MRVCVFAYTHLHDGMFACVCASLCLVFRAKYEDAAVVVDGNLVSSVGMLCVHYTMMIS